MEKPTTITLHVGERTFTTRIDTLTDGSAYFAAKYNERWASETPTDGPCFIDADGDAFEHILRFFRHGNYPLFWSRDKGFDFGRYNNLLACARFFMVEELISWLENKRYLEVVSTKATKRFFIEDIDIKTFSLLGDESATYLAQVMQKEEDGETKEQWRLAEIRHQTEIDDAVLNGSEKAETSEQSETKSPSAKRRRQS